ncbi:T4SS efffector SepA family protein [uncultured Nostoc sp.]|uniref:T4SS efffector SepA family protein n=1 Tax=uncultured Nostoc sp. TaxID=340711 RepID=UPI0035CA1185
MMPVVTIPDLIYKRLQAIAVPLEDTLITVIEKLLNEHDAREKSQQDYKIEDYSKTENYSETENYKILDPDTPSNLRHTRVLRALIDDQKIDKPNWNKIVDKTHEIAIQQGMSVEDLIKLTRFHVVQGEKNEDGFHYLPKANVSVQGVGANLAWRNTLHLMKNLKLPIEIHFEWPNKEGAAHPGKKGKLFWSQK